MRVRMYGTEEEREVDEATGSMLVNQSQARMIRPGEPEKPKRRGSESKDDAPVIDDSTRELLENAGLTSDADVAKASDEQLLAIDGIGPKKVETIRDAVPAAEPTESNRG